MATFLLIRHGETDAVGKVLAGWTPGWRLNSTGKVQAERLTRRLSRLPITAVYTSPLERAIETAEPFADDHRLQIQPCEAFGELRFGKWEGLTFEALDRREDWRRFNANRGDVRAPGGEMMIETQTRMIRQLDSLSREHPSGLIAVVSHCDPLRSVLAHYLGVPLNLILRLEIDPASISAVEACAWTSRVLCVNNTGDIPL